MTRAAALRAVCEEMRGARVDPSVRGTENEPGLFFGTDPIHVMGTNQALEYWAAQIEAAMALSEEEEVVGSPAPSRRRHCDWCGEQLICPEGCEP